MFDTRDLALYGAIVGTIGGAWTLYTSILLDRARIRVKAVEGQAMTPTSSSPVAAPHMPVLMVRVSNRGRRGASIQTVGRVINMRLAHGQHAMSQDIAQQLTSPLRLGEAEGHTFVHGQMGGYQFGGLPTTRWYVVDGGGRIHPLRERWRQRIERPIFWPWRWVAGRRDT